MQGVIVDRTIGSRSGMFALPPLSMQSVLLICVCTLVCISASRSSSNPSAPSVSWSRPQFRHVHDIVNTPEALKRLHKKVFFDACSKSSNKSVRSKTKSQWTIYHLDIVTHRAFLAARIAKRGCKLEWTAPREGDYALRVIISDSKRKYAQRILSFFVRDIWVVMAGDGFASGQGNPDEPQRILGAIPPKWADAKCARSRHSFAVKVFALIADAYRFHGLLLTFIACQGATVQQGMIGPQENVSLSQLDQIGQLMEATRVERLIRQLSTVRHPDAVVLSIGGEDLQLTHAIRSLVLGNAQAVFRAVNSSLDVVDHQMSVLGAAIRDMQIDPRSVMLMEYYDTLRDEYGGQSADCANAGLATSANFKSFDQLLRVPFNEILNATAIRNQWMYVDGIDEVFASHGICSASSMIVGFDQSLARQGNMLGAFYPNEEGHQLVAQVLWQIHLRPYLQQAVGLS